MDDSLDCSALPKTRQIKPPIAPIATQPGHLALGITPSFATDLLHSAFEGALATQIRGQLGVTKRLHSGTGRRNALLEQVLDLCQPALVHHILDTTPNPLIELLSRPVQGDQQWYGPDRPLTGWWCDTMSGLLKQFKSAQDT
jgi:hypothetical protein